MQSLRYKKRVIGSASLHRPELTKKYKHEIDRKAATGIG
jgi:hypothetical protein